MRAEKLARGFRHRSKAGLGERGPTLNLPIGHEFEIIVSHPAGARKFRWLLKLTPGRPHSPVFQLADLAQELDLCLVQFKA
jgi:hypothetical protein